MSHSIPRRIAAVVLSCWMAFSYGIPQDRHPEPKAIDQGRTLANTQLVITSTSITYDPAFRELLAIRNNMIRRILAKGVDVTVLRETYKSGNMEEFHALLGFNNEYLAATDSMMQTLRQELLNRHPELDQPPSITTNFDLDRAMEQFGKFMSKLIQDKKQQQQQPNTMRNPRGAAHLLDEMPPVMPPEGGEDGEWGAGPYGCLWYTFTLCLLEFVPLGPVAYALGSYICYCLCCWGELHDTLCFLET